MRKSIRCGMIRFERFVARFLSNMAVGVAPPQNTDDDCQTTSISVNLILIFIIVRLSTVL